MWKTLKSYIWWTHPRGSVHYDVMVTLILAFIFISPHYIDFREKPAVPVTHPTRIGSFTDPDGEIGYFVRAEDLGAAASDGKRDLSAPLAQALFPVTGPATVDRYEPVRDERGNIAAYRVWLKH